MLCSSLALAWQAYAGQKWGMETRSLLVWGTQDCPRPVYASLAWTYIGKSIRPDRWSGNDVGNPVMNFQVLQVRLPLAVEVNER